MEYILYHGGLWTAAFFVFASSAKPWHDRALARIAATSNHDGVHQCATVVVIECGRLEQYGLQPNTGLVTYLGGACRSGVCKHANALRFDVDVSAGAHSLISWLL